jgi:ribosomal protein L7/L12
MSIYIKDVQDLVADLIPPEFKDAIYGATSIGEIRDLVLAIRLQTYDVFLISNGANVVDTIKKIRLVAMDADPMSLKVAKDISDAAGSPNAWILRNVSQEKARITQMRMQEVGAVVHIRPSNFKGADSYDANGTVRE